MGHHIFCNSLTGAGQFYVFMSNGEGDKQLWRSVKAWSRGLIEICMVRLVYGSLLQTIFLPSLQDMTSAAATLYPTGDQLWQYTSGFLSPKTT